MPEEKRIARVLDQAITVVGEERVIDTLQALARVGMEPQHELTIIANAGMHNIPANFIHGEVFVASEGNLDFSSKDAIENSYRAILRRLTTKLKEHTWKRVFLVPTGPTTLAMQIKLLVYHITRLSTVDLFYSQGKHVELDMDYRSYLAPDNKT
jgi:hypothetical protein